MKIDVLEVGAYRTNCYIVSDEAGSCAVIDPGDDFSEISELVENSGLAVRCILITHGHFDHIGAAKQLADLTGAPVVIGEGDVERLSFEPDIICHEGDRIEAGKLCFEVIETPGHTPGGVCYICGDALFSGDTLFFESIGRTDLAGGSYPVLRESLLRLRDLPYAELAVYPGHMESTTLNHERKNNPFIEK